MKKPVTGPSLHSLTHIYTYIIYIYTHLPYQLDFPGFLSTVQCTVCQVYLSQHQTSLSFSSLSPSELEFGEMVDELTFSCQCQLDRSVDYGTSWDVYNPVKILAINRIIQFPTLQKHTLKHICTFIWSSGHPGFFEAPGDHTKATGKNH